MKTGNGRVLPAILLAMFCAAFDASAAPRTDHPRLLITSDDLPALRARANPANPIYAQGLLAAATAARALADQHWDWNTGQPDAAWGDTGSPSNNYSPYSTNKNPTEGYAMLFAFMALVDDANHDAWALRARAMAMYVVDQAYPGQAQQPFRYDRFATYDRASQWLYGLPLTVDWIHDDFTPAERARIRTVFLRWCREINVATVVNFDHPEPVGVYDDPALLGSGSNQDPDLQAEKQYELLFMSNNYSLAHFRNLVMLGGALDADDDPPIDPAQPFDAYDNSLRSYVRTAIGAWLYDIYALHEPAASVVSQYGIAGTNPSLGRVSGGFPVEGPLYGTADEFLAQATISLDTLGYGDAATYGPQMQLIDSSFWDRRVAYAFHNATPSPYDLVCDLLCGAPGDPNANFDYLKPLYFVDTYGDTIHAYMTDADANVYGAIAWSAQHHGHAARASAARWIMANMMTGGAAKLTDRAAGGNIVNTYYFIVPIEHFLAFDPVLPMPDDPRPGTATGMIDASLGILRDRTGWTGNDTWFGFRCSSERQPHVNGDCMQFEIFRNGEWLTREAAGYYGSTRQEVADYHNGLTLQNDDPQQSLPPNTPIYTIWQNGGQFSEDGNIGDPTVSMSVNPSHAYAFADATPLYNHSGGQWLPQQSVLGITRATRSIIWIKPDLWIIHDRATTDSGQRFKRFNLMFTEPPAVNGKTATVGFPSGQNLDIQSLLPAAATLTVDQPPMGAQAAADQMKYHLTVEDPAEPSDVTFLHVLQANDQGVTPDAATLLQNLGSANLEGALVGSVAALFPHDAGVPLSNVTYALPAIATRHFIAGFVPNAAYGATITETPNGRTVQIVPGGPLHADAAGVLLVQILGDEIFRDDFE
ncbi:MAG TPA: hypothetical protein VHE32_10655 [Rhodanobacteraceae bacterium]|nr:hypothetical protein [Rhodanobacteraceae bacterium]